MIYVVPSRGRPHAIRELIETWDNTRTFAELFVVVDEDDPSRKAYHKLLVNTPNWVHWVRYGGAGGTGMVAGLNEYAVGIAESVKYDIIGFMGDDHRPRTLGWDALLKEPASHGLAYGNDMIQSAMLPTQVVMPARFIRAMGHMAPKTLKHLYVDNYWLALGKRVGVTYVPEAVIEHMHPVAKKSKWDEGYARVNDSDMYDHDRKAYLKYVNTGALEVDAQKCLSVK